MGRNDPNDPDFVQGFTDPTPYTLFFQFLLYHGNKNYTLSEVEAGLDHQIYGGASALPAQPTNPNMPAFAIIDDSAQTGDFQLKLAYWDWSLGASGSWSVTQGPWDFPFLQAGHIIKQNITNGAGNSTWAYAMGGEYFVKAPSRITAVSFKNGTGAVGNGHRWEVLKSSAVQQTQPALSTYSVVDTGVWTTVASNTWEEVTLGTPIVVAQDEWYILRAFIGTASGQSAPIATLRSGGELVEDYASLNNGLYQVDATGFPGANPLPGIATATRVTTQLYGVSSLKFEAPA